MAGSVPSSLLRRRPQSSHRSSRPVPRDLIGHCFNYFTLDHVATECQSPTRCFRCNDIGRTTIHYKRPLSPLESGVRRALPIPRGMVLLEGEAAEALLPRASIHRRFWVPIPNSAGTRDGRVVLPPPSPERWRMVQRPCLAQGPRAWTMFVARGLQLLKRAPSRTPFTGLYLRVHTPVQPETTSHKTPSMEMSMTVPIG